MAIRLEAVQGDTITPWLDTLADLRMRVFRHYPYLYDGSPEFERDYLSTYAASPDSLFVLARNDDRVVGAATGIPMTDESDDFLWPFVDAGWEPGTIFYYGESVLMPEWRGQGIGVRFFEERESHARAAGFRYAVFCAVVRSENHPARPADYQPLDTFWRHRGYQPIDGLTTKYRWTDVGNTEETAKTMQFWYRPL